MPETDAEFTWRAHPARERPRDAAGGAVGIVVIAAVTGLICLWDGLSTMESLGVAIAAAGVLLLALNRFYFASRFTIDADGITACYPLRTQRLRWADLKRFVLDRRGGYLSTRARRTRLDAFQGMHVLFGDSRERVIERIRRAIRDGRASTGQEKAACAG